MVEDVETRIRERAHGIWESEGRPEGRAEAHWLAAAAEIVAKPARPRTPRRPADAPATPPGRRARATAKA
ncbi:DUF2934 domain-containing protein [Amaricoccus sp.]|uniref:DUF2934 domain-containing protein n=1 Tax=Amaricoccus sp. TaxID=1872485 RepID=UPI001B538DAB|nr:DUF2934 domain-containing protein [Amaricoccus sp.]MBP7003194.1 DUF2934 domain-containing protein [Amaricoccus sp.]